MENALRRLWPDWELCGQMGEGAFGKLYLISTTADGQKAYAAVKRISIPSNADAVEGARQMGVGEDLLRTYFDKFRKELNDELGSLQSVDSIHMIKPDAVILEDSPEGPGWIGYIRTGVFTPMDQYMGSVRADESEALRLGCELCDALTALEGSRLVHGEITPSNVLVLDSGNYALSDFGLRRTLARAGSTLFSEAEDAYVAPETARDGVYSAQSDIYSLAMVIGYVLNGSKMPHGRNLSLIRNVSTELLEVLNKATAYRPEERYASAADFKAALLEAGGLPAVIRRTAGATAALSALTDFSKTAEAEKKNSTDPLRPNRKRRIRSIVLAAAAVLLIAGAAYFKPWQYLNYDAPEKAPEPTPDQTVSPEPEQSQDTPELPEIIPDPIASADPEPSEDIVIIPAEPDIVPDVTDDPQQPEKQQEEEETPSGYILPSDTRAITEEDLEGMSRLESYLAFDEIYARHGKIFTSTTIKKYFESQDWYKPKTSSYSKVEKEFSDLEWQNIYFIMDWQKAQGYR